MTRIWTLFLVVFLAGCSINNNSQPNQILATQPFTDEIPTITTSHTVTPTITVIISTKITKAIPMATLEPTVILKPTIEPVDQTATEQAKGSYTENNYGGLVEITPTSCWKTTPDQSVVKVLDSVPSYSIYSGARNGITANFISIFGVVVSACEMEEVHWLDKDGKDFNRVKITFDYRRSNGEVGSFSVHQHLDVVSGENNIVRLKTGKFPFKLGQVVDVELSGIPNGSEEKNRKWLEGFENNTEWMLSLFNFGKKPFNPSELKRSLDKNSYLDLPPEMVFLNRITDRTGLRK